MAWEISFTWEGKYHQVQEVCGQMFKAGIIKTSEKAILYSSTPCFAKIISLNSFPTGI